MLYRDLKESIKRLNDEKTDEQIGTLPNGVITFEYDGESEDSMLASVEFGKLKSSNYKFDVFITTDKKFMHIPQPTDDETELKKTISDIQERYKLKEVK